MTPKPSEAELCELERLEKDATPGPWFVYPEPVATPQDAKRELALLVDGTAGSFPRTLYMLTDGGLAPAVTGCGRTSEANAAFIAAARNALPSLLDEIRRLRAALGEDK